MAVVSVIFDGTRVDDADVIGSWDNFQTNQKASLNNDFFYQGNGSISRKVTTAVDGVELDGAAQADLTSPERAILFKFLVTTVGILVDRGATGVNLYIGSGQSAYYEFWAEGGNTYPATRSWLFLLINPNLVGFRAGTTGSPSLTAADYYALSALMTDSARDDNVVMDAIDYLTVGTGLTLVGGDGADPDGTFLDFLAFDEDDIDERQAVVHSFEGALFAVAMLTVGSATATVFNDSNRSLIFLAGFFDAGTVGLAFGMSNASNDIDLNSIACTGRGASVTKKFFDTALQVGDLVSASGEDITLLGHGFSNGDYITYSRESGSDDIGPEPGDFWVSVTDVDTISLFTSFADAFEYTPLAADFALVVTFNTELDVNGTTEVITITSHPFVDGQPVRYDDGGGSENIGLTDETTYWINSIDANTFSVHTSSADAKSDTSRVNLTASGLAAGEIHNLFHINHPEVLTAAAAPGESHSIVRTYETRPDLTVTGTLGDWDAENCTFDGFSTLTFTSVCTMLGGLVLRTGSIVISTATMDSVIVSDATTTEGVALITAATLANILRCEVTAGDEGHFVEITATGAYGFVGNTFTGFWTHSNPDTADGATFNASTGVDGGTEVITTDEAHGFTTGDAVYYNDEGGTAVGGLTDGDRYYANVLSTTTLSLHTTRAAAIADSSRINLTAGSSEEHALYSGKAVVFNDTGGLVTINVSGGGDTPTIRNGIGASVVINNSVDITITVLDEAGDPIEDARVRVEDDVSTVLMNEATPANGIAVESFNFAGDTPITVRVRKSSTGGTRYFPANTSGTITTNGFVVTVTLIADGIVSA